jgi:hypothetical protein
MVPRLKLRPRRARRARGGLPARGGGVQVGGGWGRGGGRGGRAAPGGTRGKDSAQRPISTQPLPSIRIYFAGRLQTPPPRLKNPNPNAPPGMRPAWRAWSKWSIAAAAAAAVEAMAAARQLWPTALQAAAGPPRPAAAAGAEAAAAAVAVAGSLLPRPASGKRGAARARPLPAPSGRCGWPAAARQCGRRPLCWRRGGSPSRQWAPTAQVGARAGTLLCALHWRTAHQLHSRAQRPVPPHLPWPQIECVLLDGWCRRIDAHSTYLPQRLHPPSFKTLCPGTPAPHPPPPPPPPQPPPQPHPHILIAPPSTRPHAGHRVVSGLGHDLATPYAALTPLLGSHPGGSPLAGLSLASVRLSAFRAAAPKAAPAAANDAAAAAGGSAAAGKPGAAGAAAAAAAAPAVAKKASAVSQRGGFLFTHKGFSGPAVLDLSHHAVKALERGEQPPGGPGGGKGGGGRRRGAARSCSPTS